MYTCFRTVDSLHCRTRLEAFSRLISNFDAIRFLRREPRYPSFRGIKLSA